ncbi:VOC family protein [Amycolatopsis sp. NBC_01480]|uniref:VOC family protein n=1 Tax=Amycolatopsis sp. NBC_01480 TaxID=2903562 RepID=UPI002E2D25A9|nr:VOC family protein [Amycolatopsis sp. NBC_01480]
MGTRLVNLVVDAARPQELAGFWSALLGWQIAIESPDEVEIHAPADDGWELDLIFVPVPAASASAPPAPPALPALPAPVPKVTKNRIHLDLASTSPEHQVALVERALGLGARRRDLGQGDVPWVVLADPEGNEFCVLEPRAVYAGSGAVAAIVVDSGEPARLAGFWSALTGWPVCSAEDVIVGLGAPSGRGPRLEFLRSAEEKVGKNRLHLDVAPSVGEDHAAAVAQVVAAGAVRADVGQGETPWVVLADPEGNEFCVLTPR